MTDDLSPPLQTEKSFARLRQCLGQHDHFGETNIRLLVVDLLVSMAVDASDRVEAAMIGELALALIRDIYDHPLPGEGAEP
jgi:hypothetical protein